MAPRFGAVTVLIADTGHARATLADVLAEFDDCQVVAVAHDAEHAVELAAEHNPQVALLHVDVPGGAGARGHVPRGIGSRELLRWVKQCASLGAPVAEPMSAAGRVVRAAADADIRDKRSRITSLIESGGPRSVIQPIRWLVSGEIVGY